MSKVDVETQQGLRAMVARVWEKQVQMGIAIPKEPLPATLRKRLRVALSRRTKKKR